ncbi:hypothetical protein HHK36_002935 [Tetracentron sinense]|uniref:RING-type domain-containing protein n=1 Tax=Tetracentron sinense TaxID=13715 RepID=A0A834ZWN0_TETSI|nr:hypothetical protein HHK36_002935 [Tetracentron sinense]
MDVQAQMYSENLGFGFPLCGSQELIDTGSGFNDRYFNNQQQQNQMQQAQILQQRNKCLGFNVGEVGSSISDDHLLSMAVSQLLSAQVEKQKHEIDRYIALQSERLRSILQEQRKQHLAILLRRLESKTSSLLRQKEEEIAKAAKKTMELEDCLRRAEIEKQTWQRVAKENEAMAIALNNTLEQIREEACCFSSGAEDAESCCDFSPALNRQDKEEETRVARDEEEEETRKMACKGCNSQRSCVLFLPCRHLCSCKSCEAFLDYCPVCRSVKKGSIEILSVSQCSPCLNPSPTSALPIIFSSAPARRLANNAVNPFSLFKDREKILGFCLQERLGLNQNPFQESKV